MSYPGINAAPSDMVQTIREERAIIIEAINELYPPNSKYVEVQRIALQLCKGCGIGCEAARDYPGWSNQTLQRFYEACVERSEQE